MFKIIVLYFIRWKYYNLFNVFFLIVIQIFLVFCSYISCYYEYLCYDFFFVFRIIFKDGFLELELLGWIDGINILRSLTSFLKFFFIKFYRSLFFYFSQQRVIIFYFFDGQNYFIFVLICVFLIIGEGELFFISFQFFCIFLVKILQSFEFFFFCVFYIRLYLGFIRIIIVNFIIGQFWFRFLEGCFFLFLQVFWFFQV